jgi:hypothetical protein
MTLYGRPNSGCRSLIGPGPAPTVAATPPACSGSSAFGMPAWVRGPTEYRLLYWSSCTEAPARTSRIDQELRRGHARVVTSGLRIARIAGHLLAQAGLGSESAVDALVIGTAVWLGGGMVLTHDPRDLSRVGAPHPNVRVVAA